MRTRKGLSTRTSQDGTVIFQLYNTDILTFSQGQVILNTDGWKTNHSKNCMNDNLPSGYRVFQKDFNWFVETPKGVLAYEDGMSIELNDALL